MSVHFVEWILSHKTENDIKFSEHTLFYVTKEKNSIIAICPYGKLKNVTL